MAPTKPAFYVHNECDIVSSRISSYPASGFAGPGSLQWHSRAAHPQPTARSLDNAASEFYANYPVPLEDDLDDVVPALPSFDNHRTAHFLQTGLPGIAINHVPKHYADSVRGYLYIYKYVH